MANDILNRIERHAVKSARDRSLDCNFLLGVLDHDIAWIGRWRWRRWGGVPVKEALQPGIPGWIRHSFRRLNARPPRNVWQPLIQLQVACNLASLLESDRDGGEMQLIGIGVYLCIQL